MENKYIEIIGNLQEEIWNLEKEIDYLSERLNQALKNYENKKVNILRYRKSKEEKSQIESAIISIRTQLESKRSKLEQKQYALKKATSQSKWIEKYSQIEKTVKDASESVTSTVVRTVSKTTGSIIKHKRTILLSIAVVLLIVFLAPVIQRLPGFHQHEWSSATCLQAEECLICGSKNGEPLGHSWVAATCSNPKYCSRCGLREGTALDHDWIEATCTSPEKCSRCGKVRGEALGHIVPDLSCTEGDECERCGEFIEALGHDFVGQTCTEKGVCSRCGEEIDPAGHAWIEATCLLPQTCSACKITEGEALGHDYSDSTIIESTCTVPGTRKGTCPRCGEHYDEKLPLAEHEDDNEWVVTRTATLSKPGIKETHCVKCGNTVQSEEFSLSVDKFLTYYSITVACDDSSIETNSSTKLTVKCSETGITDYDVILDYDTSVLSIVFSEAIESGKDTVLVYIVTGEKSGSSNISVHTRYDEETGNKEVKKKTVSLDVKEPVRYSGGSGGSSSSSGYGSTTVYITPTGKRWHRLASCAGPNAIPTTIDEAESEGYTPCKKCAQ